MARTTKESAKAATEHNATTEHHTTTGAQSSTKPVPIAAPEAVTLDDLQIYRSRCGGALRATREKQGLSVQDVANRLKISAKQIEAIEADDFKLLPEPTIVRGFIRNYAKLLKLNSEPLLDAYALIVPSATPYQLTVKSTVNMKMTNSDKPKSSLYLWLGLASVLLACLWIFYQQYIEKPSPVQPSQGAAVLTPAPEPLPEQALPAIERAPATIVDEALTLNPALPAEVAASAASANSTITPITLPAATNQPVVANPAAAPIAPVSAQAGGQAIAAAPVAAGLSASTTLNSSATLARPLAIATKPAVPSKARLEITASQETWVNVVDANESLVYSKTLYEGNRELIEAIPPLKVTIGNAASTKVMFNGKPQDLAPHTSVNVARIKLE